MIESTEIVPGFGIVTGLAAGRSSRCARQQHAVFELAFMRIGVADGARAIIKAKYRSFFKMLIMRHCGGIAFQRRPWLVTIPACRRYVAPG